MSVSDQTRQSCPPGTSRLMHQDRAKHDYTSVVQLPSLSDTSPFFLVLFEPKYHTRCGILDYSIHLRELIRQPQKQTILITASCNWYLLFNMLFLSTINQWQHKITKNIYATLFGYDLLNVEHSDVSDIRHQCLHFQTRNFRFTKLFSLCLESHNTNNWKMKSSTPVKCLHLLCCTKPAPSNHWELTRY